MDSAIICDKVIDTDAKPSPKVDDETKTIPTNSNEKKVTCKMQNFYISLAFSLVTVELLIAVGIYCYLIKCWAKQWHYYFTTQNENKSILII